LRYWKQAVQQSNQHYYVLNASIMLSWLRRFSLVLAEKRQREISVEM